MYKKLHDTGIKISHKHVHVELIMSYDDVVAQITWSRYYSYLIWNTSVRVADWGNNLIKLTKVKLKVKV